MAAIPNDARSRFSGGARSRSSSTPGIALMTACSWALNSHVHNVTARSRSRLEARRTMSSITSGTLIQDGSPLARACQPLEEWTERLLARSTQTSFTRVDLDPHDAYTLVSSLAWAADARGDSEDDLRRMINLVLDGLRVNVPLSKNSTHG